MIVWVVFLALILLILGLDLGVFNKEAHVISTKEASIWTLIWVTVSLLFSGAIYWLYETNYVNNIDKLNSGTAVIKYITGYLIELSLSIDNIFVIAVIFASFKIPLKYQHRVLFWGILGAIFFRLLMIFFGVYLINKIYWATYVFGIFLLYTAFKMLFSKEEKFHPRDSFVYKYLRKIIPITTHLHQQKFIVKIKHIKAGTPLLVALIVIEFTDILFALDSVPAILAITSDPFLVFSSNIFAILGLRSMYFFLSNMLVRFYYLKYSLIAILTFVGVKLMLVHHYKFPELFSLGIIALSLFAGILVSLKYPKNEEIM